MNLLLQSKKNAQSRILNGLKKSKYLSFALSNNSALNIMQPVCSAWYKHCSLT